MIDSKREFEISSKLFVYNLTRTRNTKDLVVETRVEKTSWKIWNKVYFEQLFVVEVYPTNFQNFPRFSIEKSEIGDGDDSESYVGVINFPDPPRAHGYFIRAAKAASRPPHVKSYVPDYEGLRAVEPSRTG